MSQAEVCLPAAASELFARDEHGKPLISLDARSAYRFATLIRKTEQLLLRLFSQGLLSGTTHTCIGQELCQMSVVRALDHAGDVVLSNHRNHGHFLTYSGDFLGLVAEIMGRERGVCRGIGGSQHIAYRHFHSNGVQAGMTGIAVGQALAIQRREEQAIVTAFVGDGTLGEGLLYESMNLAAIWDLPLLFVVENNHVAQTTPTRDTIGGSIKARGVAFGLRTWQLDDSDHDFLSDVEAIVAQVRKTRSPGFLVIDTERLGPHSKGDDLRSEEEMERIRERDPLDALGTRLAESDRRNIETITDELVAEVHRQALESPESKFEQAPSCIFTTHLSEGPSKGSGSGRKQTVRVALNEALGELLRERPEVLLLGEDLHDPYGGAFKVTAGLSTAFKDRVISTPISEAGITGAGIGLALAGFRPVIEIMFADFVTLAMDQLYNHAVKFPGMFDEASVPLVIRTPSGGRRGYGPTHSQNPENLLAGVPGLTVVFPSHRHDVGHLLKTAVLDWPYPTVCMEHKLLYGRTVDGSGYDALTPETSDLGAHLFPTLRNRVEDPDLTVVCYGDAVNMAEEVAAQLAEEEVECEILIPSLLSPLPRHTLLKQLRSRKRVLCVEEAPTEFGFGSELGVALLEGGFKGVYRRVGPPPFPIPAARSLEASVMPDKTFIFNRVVGLFVAEITGRSQS
jgi:2-oxoisovalerate dehydrogenase E1 component